MILLLAMPLALAADDYLGHSGLEFTSEISGKINTVEEGTSPRMDLITVNVSFIPLTDEYQTGKVLTTATNPAATKIIQGNGSILVSWDSISHETEFTYNIKAEAKTQNKIKRIRRQQKFPLTNLDPAYIGLTEPTKYIDLNDNITRTAVEIIGGETDLYKIIFKVAEWVNENVHYELTTMTADAVQKSSWVLDNRRGVCDEITNLYISLLRSVGIPARFVAGQAYTNIGNKFGNHGWAEIYYPGEGWIPVDVTYGQIGWLDPTHVKFKVAADPGEPSADYSWKSRDMDLKFGDLKVDLEITGEHQEPEQLVKISVDPMKYKVGPGSYVPIQAVIENDNDFYVPLRIIVKKAPKLLDDDVSKPVLLAPGESTSVFWTVIIPEDVDPETVYTTEIEVYSPFGGTAENTIKFADSYEVVSKTWADDITETVSKREDKGYFPNLEWKCALDKDAYYQEEIATLTCKAKNIGNMKLDNIKFCLKDQCNTRNLDKGAEETIEWKLLLKDEKSGKLMAIAESESLIRYSYPSIKIVLDPEVDVINLNQQPVAYNEQGQLTFTINSQDYAKNINIMINKVGDIELKELEGGYDVIANYPGKAFYNGRIDIFIKYQDELGKEYTNHQTFNAVVTELPWYVQLLNWVNSLFETEIKV